MRPSLRPGLFLLLSGVAFSHPWAETLDDCVRIADNSQRLACFDRLAAAQGMGKAEKENRRMAPIPVPPERTATAGERDGQRLAQHWELGPESKRGLFAFRPHQDNYVLLANYSFAPNAAPFSPLAGLIPQGDGLSHTELKFQLGFKMKLLEDVAPTHTDLWLGYTQQSYWQAYNRKASSPFRETDYQPELMAVTPVDFPVLGMHARFLNVGLVHQSNGRASTLSRSWNRIYVQAGLEKGNFILLGRAWKRLPDSTGGDDNPDILDFMGQGDVSAFYRWRGQEFSALARHNFRTNRGALQLGWAFPFVERLKGYVQVFSGYGQSLIDYNYSQKTIGLGVLIDY
ncbi:MAG TPA: phospholipase A [Noviherbaspirillum sp.]|nr:phospholipase A [Noviherbaspirillum sp.]